MRNSRITVCSLAFALLSAASTPALVDDETGFAPLFDGSTLSGWTQEGASGFAAKSGVLICDGGGNWPSWLRTAEVFENFVLRLEYRTFFGAESGVFFSAPLHGRISHVGYEVQLGGAGGTRLHSTGAIFDAVAPLQAVRAPAEKDAFQTLEIEFQWPRLRVRMNDQLVQDLDVSAHEALRYRPRLGHIGLQDRGKPVHFRNLRIKRLADQVRAQWQPLLASAELNGWEVSANNSATWSCVPGELTGQDGHGYQISSASYRNCEIETYIRSSPLANGGIFLRWLSERDRGFEIQIEDIPDGNDPTGSIYGRVRAQAFPFTPGEWVLMQIFLEEARCVVRLNGVVVAQSEQMNGAREGRIALQMHSSNGWVRWKDLRVRKLPPRAN